MTLRCVARDGATRQTALKSAHASRYVPTRWTSPHHPVRRPIQRARTRLQARCGRRRSSPSSCRRSMNAPISRSWSNGSKRLSPAAIGRSCSSTTIRPTAPPRRRAPSAQPTAACAASAGSAAAALPALASRACCRARPATSRSWTPTCSTTKRGSCRCSNACARTAPTSWWRAAISAAAPPPVCRNSAPVSAAGRMIWCGSCSASNSPIR